MPISMPEIPDSSLSSGSHTLILDDCASQVLTDRDLKPLVETNKPGNLVFLSKKQIELLIKERYSTP